MVVDEPSRSLHITPMAVELASADQGTGASAGTRTRRRSIPIAVLLGLSLGALVLVAAASVLVISMWSGIQTTIDQLESQAVLGVHTIEQRLNDHLSPAVDQLRFVHDLIASGQLDPQDDARMKDILTGAVAATPQVDGIVFIDLTYVMRGIGRSGGGAYWIEVDQSGDEGFRAGVAEGLQGPRSAYWIGTLWSREIDETVAVVRQPVFVDGTYTGILATGVAVSKLSRFVAGAESQLQGRSFILRGQNEVIAHADLVEGYDALTADRKLPTIGEFGDPVLAAMWHPERFAPESDSRPADMDGHQIRLGDDDWFFMYRTIETYGPEPWIVGTYFRGGDFEQEFERLENAGWVGLAVVIAGVLAAFFIGRWIALPVRRLAHTAQRIGTLRVRHDRGTGPEPLTRAR